jgi:predicted secreted protein
MASNAVAGVGTVFNRWNGSAWVPIAEINSITGPSMSRDTIDVTSLDSTGGYREFITGFRNAGTVVLAMNFTRDTYELMKADFESNVAGNYQIDLPDAEGTSLDFEGLVTELPLTIPADDKITADVTIQVTGKVEISSGGTTTP